jgi:hypothetical protein
MGKFEFYNEDKKLQRFKALSFAISGMMTHFHVTLG